MNLSTYLSKKTKTELIREILTLAHTFPAIRDYYVGVSGKSDEVLARFKKKIRDEFFPARGEGDARAGVVRSAISDFKKVSKSKRDLAKLLLFHVEQGVKYTNEYGDIDENFYSTLESSFEAATKLMSKEKLLPEFQKRCSRIVKNTEDIGWGFHDFLAGVYYSTYGED